MGSGTQRALARLVVVLVVLTTVALSLGVAYLR